MATDAPDIFGGQRPPTEQEIQDYLAGKLSPDRARAVEEAMAMESMESDALEGLQQLSHEETQEAVAGIRRNLKASLSVKKRRRRGLADQRWTWMAILIVLLLVVLCYALIHMSAKK